MEAFIREMTPVYERTVDVPFEKIKIGNLDFEIEPIHFVNLAWLFE
jgi:hypothetical protein